MAVYDSFSVIDSFRGDCFLNWSKRILPYAAEVGASQAYMDAIRNQTQLWSKQKENRKKTGPHMLIVNPYQYPEMSGFTGKNSTPLHEPLSNPEEGFDRSKCLSNI